MYAASTYRIYLYNFSLTDTPPGVRSIRVRVGVIKDIWITSQSLIARLMGHVARDVRVTQRVGRRGGTPKHAFKYITRENVVPRVEYEDLL